MKWLWIGIGVGIGAPLLFFASIYAVSEVGGEVVVLDRAAEDGTTSRVRIWIVDADDASWVEHGAPDAHWVTRLSDEPTLTLERNGEKATYRAAPDPASHARYHELRKAKYGWADQYIELVAGEASECTGVPVRLERVGAAVPTP